MIPVERMQFYAMMVGSILCVKTSRSSLNSVVPAMAADPSLGLSSAAQAAMLSSFYPGYLLTQLPAGPIVQVLGGKGVMTMQLVGTAAIFLSIPAAMKKGGTAMVGVALTVLGLLQGPMSPSLSQMNRDWIPKDDPKERSLALRMQGLAHTSAPMLAALVTPFLARGGWRRVFYGMGGVIGVFSALWALTVSGKPPIKRALSAAVSGGDPALGKQEPAAAPKPEETGPQVEWRILTLPSSVSLIFWQICSNMLFMILQQWGPTFYTTSLGCSQERAGLLLAAAQFVNFPAALASTFIESRVLQLCGNDTLRMRKAMNMTGSVLDAVFALGYGLSRNAASATLCYAGVMFSGQFHMSGAWPLFYEMGGRDVATLSSVANTLANVTGLVVPFIGVGLLQRFNSWVPLLAIAAALKLVAGFWLSAAMSTQDGREQLRLRAAASKAV